MDEFDFSQGCLIHLDLQNELFGSSNGLVARPDLRRTRDYHMREDSDSYIYIHVCIYGYISSYFTTILYHSTREWVSGFGSV